MISFACCFPALFEAADREINCLETRDRAQDTRELVLGNSTALMAWPTSTAEKDAVLGGRGIVINSDAKAGFVSPSSYE
jgi:hypothetical protein